MEVIIGNLAPGEQPLDRSRLVARVFKIKLYSLMKDITKRGIFVQSVHSSRSDACHVLTYMWLYNPKTSSQLLNIDQFVCAEISTEESPRFRDIVSRCMVCGLCVSRNPRAPCMDAGQCKKQFPHKFNSKRCTVGEPVNKLKWEELKWITAVLSHALPIWC